LLHKSSDVGRDSTQVGGSFFFFFFFFTPELHGALQSFRSAGIFTRKLVWLVQQLLNIHQFLHTYTHTCFHGVNMDGVHSSFDIRL